jgi:hypothetical protein
MNLKLQPTIKKEVILANLGQLSPGGDCSGGGNSDCCSCWTFSPKFIVRHMADTRTLP